MRKLFLLRGAPGAGKSTLLKTLNVENYALNSDMFKLLIQSPLLNEDGGFHINQSYGRREAWNMLKEVVEKRMFNGDLIIVDASHSKSADLMTYRMLADKYRYEVIIIDFTSVPIEVALERNKNREAYKVVPETYIEKVYKHLKYEKIPENIKVISYEDAEKELFPLPIDLSHYKKIHHIGDIHGCYDVLQSYFKKGLKDDELYIFTGDYIDRGIQNGKVMEFLLSIIDYPNVILLEGNHEKHLWNWANRDTAHSLVFEYDTKPELESYGIQRKEVKRFCKKLKQYLHYIYNEKEVLVTHGGLPLIPKNIQFVSAEQLIRGVGDAKTPIDSIFNQNEKGTNRYQVHGHRNYGLLPYTPDTQSFNLEGGVDDGGYLRIILLDENGFNSVQIKNNVYKEKVDTRKIG